MSIVELGDQMRAAQAKYKRTNSFADFQAMRALEERYDKYIKDVLTRREQSYSRSSRTKGNKNGSSVSRSKTST